MRTTTRVWDALQEQFGDRTFLLLSIDTVEEFVAFYEHAQAPRGLNLQVEQSLKAWTQVELHLKLPAGEEPLTIPANVTFAAPTGLVVTLDTDAVAERWLELGEDFGILDGGLEAQAQPLTDPFIAAPAAPTTREGAKIRKGRAARASTGDHTAAPALEAPEPSRAMRPGRRERDSRDLPLLQQSSEEDTPVATAARRPESIAEPETPTEHEVEEGSRTAVPFLRADTPSERRDTLPHDSVRADLLGRIADRARLYDGDLADCAVREWLNDATGRSEDGLCTVTLADATYYVLVSAGNIVDIQMTPEAGTSMQGMLAQTDFVDPSALVAAGDEARASARDLGEVLLEQGTLDQKTVVCVRHARVTYLLRNLMQATEGRFAYTPLSALPYPARIPAVKF